MVKHPKEETRKPYNGSKRSLVIALDVGTTFSGVSYALLEPGEVPKIVGVTRFPGQEHVAGNSKIPSIMYYDSSGRLMAAGAEAEAASILDAAEEEGWIKSELFKLRLRPKSMKLEMNGMRLEPLPPGKNAVQVFGDFLGYLFRCTRTFIMDTHAGGESLWGAVERDLQFVLSHPNGWEGAQQTKMRRAAVHGALIPDTDEGRSRIRFVTEGEASLHACVLSGLATDVLSHSSNHGFLIADAGGGTLDISSYAIRGTAPLVMEEIAPPDCIFAGSVFVSRRARTFLEQKLRNSKYGTSDSVEHITRKFDESTKRLFRDKKEAQYIPFGSPLDKDLAVGIRAGQLKLTGEEVAALFEPSIEAAVDSIQGQLDASHGMIKSVWLVGGFAASPWLFSQLQIRLAPMQVTVSRPDTQTSKAVADGAIGFYCDHHVSARMSKFMYGVEFLREYDPNDDEHIARKHRLCELPSGPKLLPDAFDCILARSVRVKESTVFSRKYCTELTSLSMLSVFEVEIWCYRGGNEIPKWILRQDETFSTLCVVRADLSPLASSALPKKNRSGKTYWTIVFSVEIHFGLTEFKARIKWVDNGTTKYGPATIVYNEGGHHRGDEDDGDTVIDTTAQSSRGRSGQPSRPHTREPSVAAPMPPPPASRRQSTATVAQPPPPPPPADLSREIPPDPVADAQALEMAKAAEAKRERELAREKRHRERERLRELELERQREMERQREIERAKERELREKEREERERLERERLEREKFERERYEREKMEREREKMERERERAERQSKIYSGASSRAPSQYGSSSTNIVVEESRHRRSSVTTDRASSIYADRDSLRERGVTRESTRTRESRASRVSDARSSRYTEEGNATRIGDTLTSVWGPAGAPSPGPSRPQSGVPVGPGSRPISVAQSMSRQFSNLAPGSPFGQEPKVVTTSDSVLPPESHTPDKLAAVVEPLASQLPPTPPPPAEPEPVIEPESEPLPQPTPLAPPVEEKTPSRSQSLRDALAKGKKSSKTPSAIATPITTRSLSKAGTSVSTPVNEVPPARPTASSRTSVVEAVHPGEGWGSTWAASKAASPTKSSIDLPGNGGGALEEAATGSSVAEPIANADASAELQDTWGGGGSWVGSALSRANSMKSRRSHLGKSTIAEPVLEPTTGSTMPGMVDGWDGTPAQSVAPDLAPESGQTPSQRASQSLTDRLSKASKAASKVASKAGSQLHSRMASRTASKVGSMVGTPASAAPESEAPAPVVQEQPSTGLGGWGGASSLASGLGNWMGGSKADAGGDTADQGGVSLLDLGENNAGSEAQAPAGASEEKSGWGSWGGGNGWAQNLDLDKAKEYLDLDKAKEYLDLDKAKEYIDIDKAKESLDKAKESINKKAGNALNFSAKAMGEFGEQWFGEDGSDRPISLHDMGGNSEVGAPASSLEPPNNEPTFVTGDGAAPQEAEAAVPSTEEAATADAPPTEDAAPAEVEAEAPVEPAEPPAAPAEAAPEEMQQPEEARKSKLVEDIMGSESAPGTAPGTPASDKPNPFAGLKGKALKDAKKKAKEKEQGGRKKLEEEERKMAEEAALNANAAAEASTTEPEPTAEADADGGGAAPEAEAQLEVIEPPAPIEDAQGKLEEEKTSEDAPTGDAGADATEDTADNAESKVDTPAETPAVEQTDPIATTVKGKKKGGAKKKKK